MSAFPKVTTWSLVLGCVFFVLVAPDVDADRDLATRIRTEGEQVTVQSTRVLVQSHRKKIFREVVRVDGVRVLLPGRDSDVPLSLLTERRVPGDTPRGWQEATEVTGYVPPLDVVVLRMPDGAVISVVAEDDLKGRLERDGGPEDIRWAGAVLLVVGILSIMASVWTVRRRERLASSDVDHPPAIV